MAIDFTPRECLDTPVNRIAKFEIMRWEDPVMAGTSRGPDGHFVIDGLVPANVALEINALFARPENNLDILGLDELEYVEIATETGRVLIDGLVPLTLAQQAQAICNAHNASLPPTDA